MTSTRNQVRFDTEVGIIVALALQVGRGCTAEEAAAELGFTPTQAAVAKAAARLAEPALPAPTDPFAGLPR